MSPGTTHYPRGAGLRRGRGDGGFLADRYRINCEGTSRGRHSECQGHALVSRRREVLEELGRLSRRPSAASRQTFPEPNAPGTSSRVYLDRSEIDQGIYRAVLSFVQARA